MRKTSIFITAIISILCSLSTNAQDLKSILSRLGAQDSTSATSGKNALGSILGNLIASDNIDMTRLTGIWKYDSPAVAFKTDNLLKKAGGAAASQTIEAKLASYYKLAGISNLTLTIESDSTFVMSMRRTQLKGTITPNTHKESESNFTFNFNVAGKIKLGKVDAYVTMSGNSSLSITFDASKLMMIVEKAGMMTGNTSLKSASALLNEYDGISAGFKLSK